MNPEANFFCRNCAALFDSTDGNTPCPTPSPGKPYVDCGKGGHWFEEAKVAAVEPLALVSGRFQNDAPCELCGMKLAHHIDAEKFCPPDRCIDCTGPLVQCLLRTGWPR